MQSGCRREVEEGGGVTRPKVDRDVVEEPGEQSDGSYNPSLRWTIFLPFSRRGGASISPSDTGEPVPSSIRRG